MCLWIASLICHHSNLTWWGTSIRWCFISHVSRFLLQVGASLSGYDFHAGAAYHPAPFREAFRASVAEPGSGVGGSGAAGWQNLRPVKPSYEWSAPQADPYSILNVYARRSRQHPADQSGQPGYAFDAYPSSMASGAGAMRPLPIDHDTSGVSDDNSTVASEGSYSEDFTAPHSKSASAHVSARSRSHVSQTSGARSPVSGRSASEKQRSSKHSSLHQSQLDKIGRPSSSHPSHHSEAKGSRSQRYTAVPLWCNFLENSHNRHPKACLYSEW